MTEPTHKLRLWILLPTINKIRGVFSMKTKLYRTITLVLAIVMLLGVTPAFADKKDEWHALLTAEDYDNHNYVSMPYDFNVAIDDNAYIPFSAMWEYGNRTSASSSLIDGIFELKNGVCYVNDDDPNDTRLTARGIRFGQRAPMNMLPSYFEGNTYLKTAIVESLSCPNAFYNAPELSLAILLHDSHWNDWTNTPLANGYVTPGFPRNITVISGLVDGEMAIANSTNKNTRTVFKSRNEFIEAVKPILAAANLPDEAWTKLPKEFGGQTTTNLLNNRKVSDWAKDEVTKALQVGIITSSGTIKIDSTVVAQKIAAATYIINTYEAICKANGKSFGYPSDLPKVFNPFNDVENKGGYLGIFKGDGTTYTYNGKTYSNFDGISKLTREQMAAMLVRLAKACGETLPTGTMPFTDAMSDWAKPEISACYGAGLIKGTSATTFGALDNVTDEQAIVLCYRAYEYLTTH